ncbi:MAG: NAD(+) synthase [Caldisericaceae bacterium]|nr:NAD(+) synthase [Caldisericaceae bacterium]
MRNKFFTSAEMPQVAEKIEGFIKEYVEKFEKEGVVIGVSGGIDSAVLVKLSAKALGRDKVTLVHITERDTLKESTRCAKAIAKDAGIPLKFKSLTLMLTHFGLYSLQPFLGYIAPEKLKEEYARKRREELSQDGPLYLKHLLGKGDEKFRKDIAYYETKARAITLTLYYFANLENKLVIDSGNKTEISVGYYARYGEAGDIMPLAGLYKTEVYELAKYVGVPEVVLNRHPAPDIIPGITDEVAIGMKYSVLDKILLLMENGETTEEIAERLEVPESNVKYVEKIRKYAKLLSEIPIKLEL